MDKLLSNRVVFLSGDEALAQGAYEEGLRFAASYPGTPASEILEYLSCCKGVDAQWSVNEKVAFEVALGASIAGWRALYASKHVGINVAMDPLMTSAYTGVNAGFVVVTADDPGIHSSQNEQDNRFIAKFAKIPLIEPSSPAEAREFVKVALSLSEEFDTPVLFRLTTRIAHTKENMVIGARKDIPSREFRVDTEKYVMVPRNAYQRHIVLEEKLVRLQRYSENTLLNRMELKNKKIGFITGGVSYLYAREMYPDASFLKLGLGFPFPERKAKAFAARVKEVVVLEELEPFLEEQARTAGIRCKTKKASYRIGELRPEYIPDILGGKDKKEDPGRLRKPVMCPGCPHRAVFTVLKKLKTVVSGDIGCYTLGALPPMNSLHTCVCMGGGITIMDGMSRALGRNIAGVIGDSTFVHSGITGLINMVYNKAKGVVIILDNGTTAMTGNQPHPATGRTVKKEETARLRLEELCKACGVAAVDVIDPRNIKVLESGVKKRLEGDVLSVIIARAPCKLIDRTRTDVPSYQAQKCKKCYLCLEIDCPALIKEESGLIEINPLYCTGCGLCAQVCPFKAIGCGGKVFKNLR
ncbi:MAG: thiamine pyrophosphate-dependent enzyme [Candidatus Omnitrophica bacterium]|nr:thiamine pyrophosphate-dependent enzyme [Candidatus Omnitrophota bacterium]